MDFRKKIVKSINFLHFTTLVSIVLRVVASEKICEVR